MEAPHPAGDPVRADFRNFLYLVWKHLNLPDPTPIQYDIAHFMQHGPRRRMVKGFRGVGKSWIAAAYVLWRLLKDPNINVLVISASKQRSDAFTTFCLRLIEEMPILQHLRPREGQRRSMVSFDVGPAKASQSPSVMSIGIMGSATGMRADLIIPDDVEVPNNSETLVQREKLSERIKEADAILKPDGEVVYLGTDQTEDSIYRDLPARGYTVRVWPARYPDEAQIEAYAGTLAPYILEKVAKDPSLVGHTTEPLRFTDMELAAKELSYGRAGFALQFMLDPRLSDEDQYPLKLSDLIVHPLDSDMAPERLIWSGQPDNVINDVPNVGMRGDRLYRGILPRGDQTQYFPYTGTIMGIDPAGRGADETGYAVVSALNGMLYLRDAGAVKGYHDESLEKLANIAKKYAVNHVVYEPNFGDGMFGVLLARVFQRVHPCRIEESERSTAQKERRIIDTLEPVMSAHRLVVDRGLFKRDYDSTAHLPAEQANRYRLFYQLTRITRQKGSLHHDDRLDALALAVHYWQKVLGTDPKAQAEKMRQKALEAELRKFMRSATGRQPRKPNWIAHG